MAFVPAPIVLKSSQPESPTQINNFGPRIEQPRCQINRYFRRGSKKNQRQLRGNRHPPRPQIINRPSAIFGFAVLQKNRLDVGMARKNGDEFSAAVTAE